MRVVLFADITTNEDYHAKWSFIKEKVNNCGNAAPAYSLVAQKPLGGGVVAEVCNLVDDQFAIVEKPYGVDVLGDGYREIVVGGISSDYLNLPIKEQSEEVSKIVVDILENEGCPIQNIVRQWNYIQNITLEDNGQQHYQLFNDARSYYYNRSQWEFGYPAATGIGATAGGVMIDFNAVICGGDITAIDNPLQIAAHDYSKGVLIGEKTAKTTPKFERAKSVENEDEILIYVSGTAAIRGEASLEMNAASQTITTMENIFHLISEGNQSLFGVKSPQTVDCQTYKHM